jgi:uncharacterized membrane protein
MDLDPTTTYWILVFSYWVHMLATVIWLGGLALMGFIGWPALRRGTLTDNQWLSLQKRFMPWANGSLVILLITGFIQMTLNVNYSGFMVIDSLWAWSMLLKHIAFIGMVIIGVYVQFGLYPAMDRLKLLMEKRPNLAQNEQSSLQEKEIRLLRLNMGCATLVLFFTAMATAVSV